MAAQTKGTELANHLVSTWSPMLSLAANEERVVTRHFMSGDDVEVTKVGNQLNIRKIGSITAQELGTSDNPESINFHTNTEANVTVDPTFAYGAVSLDLSALTRALDWPGGRKYSKAYRTQIAAAIAAKMDLAGGTLAASLTTNQAGGLGQHLNKALMLNAIGKLIRAGKDKTSINRISKGTAKYFCYHPDEWEYLQNIPDITAANLRGDTQHPNVDGAVWDAWGLTLNESGNVYQASGITHNLLHVKDSHVLGYNDGPEANFLKVQEFHLAWRIIGWMEYAIGEVWDEYAVDVMTG